MRNVKLNKLIKISLLSAIAFILMYLEIGIPVLFPSFLKIEFSDLPALIAAFAFGPFEGVAVELIKNLLHGVFKGSTMFVGELANFSVGSIMVLVAGLIYRKNKTKKNAILSLFSGVGAMAIGASLLNYFLLLPLYSMVLHIPLDGFVSMGKAVNPFVADLKGLIIFAILPFNLVKGAIVSFATVAIYKYVSVALHTEGNFKHEGHLNTGKYKHPNM